MSRWRGAMILGTLYAPPAAAWVVIARDLAPSRTTWGAVLLGWLFHLVVVLAIRGTDRWIVRERSPALGRRARAIDRWLIAFALAFLMLTALSGPRHDYVAFLEIWDAVRAGRDPWWIHERWRHPLNAYGPLFLVLALPAAWNALAPKLLFALAYCLFAVLFLKGGMARSGMGAGQGGGGFPAVGLLAWLLSPFAWVEVAYYGHFDVLVAIACVAAVAFLLRGREALTGASLALGFLLKLIPVVIVPFFALDRTGGRIRVRVRLLAGAILPMVVGYGASVLIWGPTAFRPFTFAQQRESTLMSIFRFLRGGASPLHRFIAHPNLDAWGTPCLVVAGLLVFLACQWRRTDPATSALLAVLTTLLFYKVGFLQYQMIPFLLMADWLGRFGPSLARDRRLAVAIAGYFGWLTSFDLFYCYAGGIMQASGPWGWVADRVGLPMFLLGSFLLVSLLGFREGGLAMAKMEHFAIYAADSPALKDFYVEAMGLRVIVESGGEPPGFFLADDDGMALEIIGRPEGASAVDQRWVCHVAFRVEDFAAARAALERRGIVFEPDTAVEGAAIRTAFFKDPEGNRCQIVWRDPPLGK